MYDPNEPVVAYGSLEELAEAVSEFDGVLSVPAWVVRDAYGAERLGNQVRANISSKLRGLGISHWPDEFPDRQTSDVRLYRAGTGAAELIEAVLVPGERGDDLIRASLSEESTKVLQKIKEMVCE